MRFAVRGSEVLLHPFIREGPARFSRFFFFSPQCLMLDNAMAAIDVGVRTPPLHGSDSM